MIRFLDTQLLSVVYPKVPYFSVFFTLYTTPLGSVISSNFLKHAHLSTFPSLLLGGSHPGDVYKILCTLMTPSCTSLSLLQILFFLLWHSPPLSLAFSLAWTWTNCFSIRLHTLGIDSEGLIIPNNVNTVNNRTIFMVQSWKFVVRLRTR